MNLNTITALRRPGSADEVADWRAGYAWLGGGTWLFSEPQPGTDTLIDIDQLGWRSLEPRPDGLVVGATCRIAELHSFEGPSEWTALPLLRQCCDSFLASFKIWNAATVGGNVCMSLPAGPMISLTTALEGICTLWPRGGAAREVAVQDFVTGNHLNVLRPGELLRSIRLPAAALRKRTAFRHFSLTKIGRSAALLIGSLGSGGDLRLTVTAATDRPMVLNFPTIPSAAELRETIETQISDGRWFDDVHGSAAFKRHITGYFAEQIRTELAEGAPA
jgi:CO/xanthine dehydrogenase FAD-binding subunit